MISTCVMSRYIEHLTQRLHQLRHEISPSFWNKNPWCSVSRNYMTKQMSSYFTGFHIFHWYCLTRLGECTWTLPQIWAEAQECQYASCQEFDLQACWLEVHFVDICPLLSFDKHHIPAHGSQHLDDNLAKITFISWLLMTVAVENDTLQQCSHDSKQVYPCRIVSALLTYKSLFFLCLLTHKYDIEHRQVAYIG